LSLVKKEYFQFIPWQFENFCLSIKEAGERNRENIEKMTFIMDYEGLALRQYTCKPGKIQYSFLFDNLDNNTFYAYSNGNCH
jgi:hypothetical protein